MVLTQSVWPIPKKRCSISSIFAKNMEKIRYPLLQFIGMNWTKNGLRIMHGFILKLSRMRLSV